MKSLLTLSRNPKDKYPRKALTSRKHPKLICDDFLLCKDGYLLLFKPKTLWEGAEAKFWAPSPLGVMLINESSACVTRAKLPSNLLEF